VIGGDGLAKRRMRVPVPRPLSSPKLEYAEVLPILSIDGRDGGATFTERYRYRLVGVGAEDVADRSEHVFVALRKSTFSMSPNSPEGRY